MLHSTFISLPGLRMRSIHKAWCCYHFRWVASNIHKVAVKSYLLHLKTMNLGITKNPSQWTLCKQLLVLNDIIANIIMNKEKSITLVLFAAAALPLSWGVRLNPLPDPAQKQIREFSENFRLSARNLGLRFLIIRSFMTFFFFFSFQTCSVFAVLYKLSSSWSYYQMKESHWLSLDRIIDFVFLLPWWFLELLCLERKQTEMSVLIGYNKWL